VWLVGSSPDQAETIQQEVEKSFGSFPPAYRIADPDMQWDEDYQYVVLQRCQLHVVGSMTILAPLKGYLTKALDPHYPSTETSFRARAVSISLKLMNASRRLFDCVFPANAKFHFATFLIFDTASFLCSAVIRDSTHTLPQREKVISAVRVASNLMEQLSRLTKCGAICSAILGRFVAKLGLSPEESLILQSLSPEGPGIGLELSETQPSVSSGSPGETPTCSVASTTLETFSGVPDTYNSLDWVIPGMEATQHLNLSDFTDIGFGELNQIWDWENLDLSFDFFSPVAT
jgi:hypothetical protein